MESLSTKVSNVSVFVNKIVEEWEVNNENRITFEEMQMLNKDLQAINKLING